MITLDALEVAPEAEATLPAMRVASVAESPATLRGTAQMAAEEASGDPLHAETERGITQEEKRGDILTQGVLVMTTRERDPTPPEAETTPPTLRDDCSLFDALDTQTMQELKLKGN